MPRTAPGPNAIAIPGMNPGTILQGGGGDAGGGSGKGGGGSGGKKGKGTGKGKEDAEGGGKDAPNGECTQEGHPVDVASGRVLSEQTDFTLKGIYRFEWTRRYSSSAARKDQAGLGHGWTHNFGWSLRTVRRSLVVGDDGGVEQEFPFLEPDSFHRGAYGRTLRRDAAGAFSLVTGNGLTLGFEPVPDDKKSWRLAWMTDYARNAMRLVYEGSILARIVDTVGRTIELRRNQEGRIARLETADADGSGRTVTLVEYTYSQEGDLVRAKDAEGFSFDYRYEDHLLAAERNRVGLTYHFVYDRAVDPPRCKETWGSYGESPDPALAPNLPQRFPSLTAGRRIRGIFHRLFDYEGGVTDVTTTRDGNVRYAANALGIVDKSVTADGAVTTTDFDDVGNVLRIVDPEENVWTFERDAQGRLLVKTDPLGRKIVFEYDAVAEKPSRMVVPNGGRWRFGYDENGVKVSDTDPLGATRVWVHDERGLLVETIGPLGQRVKVRRGWHGGSEQVSTANGDYEFRYDYWGRVVWMKAPDGREAEFRYDRKHQLVWERNARGYETWYEYDGEGNIVLTRLPNGTVRRAVYGGHNWITEYQDESGNRTRLFYSYEGDLVEIRNPKDESFEVTYGPAGHVLNVKDFDGSTVSYTYSLTSRRTSMTDRDGGVTRYEYDAVGNLLLQVYPDGSEDEYAYNALDFVVSAKNEDSTVTFERDLRGRVLKETVECAGVSVDVESEYDAAGRRIARRSSGREILLERRASGEVTARTFDGRRQDCELDRAGRVIGWSLPSGVQLKRSFDAGGWTSRVQLLVPRAARVVHDHLTEMASFDAAVDRSFTYSPSSELLEVHDSRTGLTTYGYDAVGHLLWKERGATRETFACDATGNALVASPSDVAGGNRLVRAGATSLDYDEGGRVIRKIVQTDEAPKVWQFEWHGSGSLLGVADPKGAKIRFAYDAFGRRLRKFTDDGATDVRFAWDGNSLLSETLHPGEGAAERHYVHDPANPFVPIAQWSDGQWFNCVTSPAGAPTELIDGQGRLAWQASFKPFGEIETEQRQGADTALRFQGQYADEETGLHYNRFRYYDPLLGRYLSPDPIQIEGGLNEYAYGTNPISSVDPFGLEDGAALTAAMVEETGIQKPPGHQAHHIIPEELYNQPHPLIKAAGEQNNPHTADNGVYLPAYAEDRDNSDRNNSERRKYIGQALHRGSHPEYTEAVRQRMDEEYANLEQKYGKGKVPPCQAKAAMERVQGEFRDKMRRKSYTLNNADPDLER